jgi:8-oxo-dGTP pyrophosphatase MutT (NUDIX family)
VSDVSLGIVRIRDALAAKPPQQVVDPTRPRAAVAVVLREAAGGPELLLIERSKHPDDPWSGHMAFPGGRVDPGDPDPQSAAERETLEEVGLSLTGAELLGRLDDIEGRQGGRTLSLVISAHVYHCEEPGELVLNHEVASAHWVPLARLHDAAYHVEYTTPYGGYPGILVGEPDRHVVWGLTYRFLEIFLATLGRPLPQRWVRTEGDRRA